MLGFTDKFDSFVCMGDSISVDHDGFTITARIEYDDQYKIDDDDVHNVDQSVTGCDEEQYQTLLKNRQAWMENEWWYGGVVLSVSKNDIVLDDHAASLWGIEVNYPTSDNGYLTDVANELLSEALERGHDAIESLTS
jgi:hypothetical protein